MCDIKLTHKLHTTLTDRPWATVTVYKCLVNAKRPCDCRVLCLCLKSSLCSCAHSISDMTSFGCHDRVRDTVRPVLWMSTWRNSRKRRKTAGVTMILLRILTRVSAAADRPVSYGNQTISSARPSCWIQISTVDVINIAADHHVFMTFTGELSWQRLRRSAVDFYSKKRKNRSLSHPLGDLGVTYALHPWLVGKPVIDFVLVVIELSPLSLTVETLWAEIGRSRRFSKISDGRRHRPATTVGVRKLEWLPFGVVSKYSQRVI